MNNEELNEEFKVARMMLLDKLQKACNRISNRNVRVDILQLISEFAGLVGEMPFAGADKKKVQSLTPQERRVLYYVCNGLTNIGVGQKMRISKQTVKTHLYRIYKKLGVKSRTQAICAVGVNLDIMESQAPTTKVEVVPVLDGQQPLPLNAVPDAAQGIKQSIAGAYRFNAPVNGR